MSFRASLGQRLPPAEAPSHQRTANKHEDDPAAVSGNRASHLR
jgi:hypothetical protein